VSGVHREPVVREAPAKLNLYLHVTGKRPDGYHLLDSLVAFATIGDELHAAPSDRLSLAAEGPFADKLDGPPGDNLVWRAAERLAALAGRPAAAKLRLVKNLPVASGIGGGSSDAAATLKALCALWGIAPDEEGLAKLGLSLGADVPVCLNGKGAWLGGIGEEVLPAPALPPAPLVLVNPGIGLPTPAVFKARRGEFTPANRFAQAPKDAAELADLLAHRRNDLTEAAISIVPSIAEVIDCLAKAEGSLIARMSGSGATCFALFRSDAQAKEAAHRIVVEHPSWWAAAGNLVS